MTTTKYDRPAADEYAPYYGTYIAHVPEGSIVATLAGQIDLTLGILRAIPESLAGKRYAEGKWTIKDILQHLIDAERIFAYRALRFARNDQTALASFEENEYVDEASANNRSIQELLTELAVVRQATLSLFKSFSNEQLLRKGIASNNPMSVRALGFVIIGHQNHHQRVFEERYL